MCIFKCVYIYIVMVICFYIYIYIVLNNSVSHIHIKNIFILNLVLVNHKWGRSLFSSPIWLASLSLNHFLFSLYYIFIQIILYIYDIGQNIFYLLTYLLTYYQLLVLGATVKTFGYNRIKKNNRKNH